jgi:ABC-type nickel/cobalt efflux system permease component RcnA
MPAGSRLLLIGSVAAVGVLHTMVPDHWIPIAVMARQRRWSRWETGRAALLAGTGHVLSTLAIATVVWIAGATAARRLGSAIDTVSSLALLGFGLWIAVSALHEQRHRHGHSHPHGLAAPPNHGEGANPTSEAAPRNGDRTALLLIVGSSPMVEGIPAFFAAAKFGAGLVSAMAAVFSAATVATYVLLCVSSASGLQRIGFNPIERYGEVLSGAAIALLGLAFWVWPLG